MFTEEDVGRTGRGGTYVSSKQPKVASCGRERFPNSSQSAMDESHFGLKQTALLGEELVDLVEGD